MISKDDLMTPTQRFERDQTTARFVEEAGLNSRPAILNPSFPSVPIQEPQPVPPSAPREFYSDEVKLIVMEDVFNAQAKGLSAASVLNAENIGHWCSVRWKKLLIAGKLHYNPEQFPAIHNFVTTHTKKKPKRVRKTHQPASRIKVPPMKVVMTPTSTQPKPQVSVPKPAPVDQKPASSDLQQGLAFLQRAITSVESKKVLEDRLKDWIARIDLALSE